MKGKIRFLIAPLLFILLAFPMIMMEIFIFIMNHTRAFLFLPFITTLQEVFLHILYIFISPILIRRIIVIAKNPAIIPNNNEKNLHTIALKVAVVIYFLAIISSQILIAYAFQVLGFPVSGLKGSDIVWFASFVPYRCAILICVIGVFALYREIKMQATNDKSYHILVATIASLNMYGLRFFNFDWMEVETLFDVIMRTFPYAILMIVVSAIYGVAYTAVLKKWRSAKG